MIKSDKITIGIVSSIIIVSVTLVFLFPAFEPEPKPEPRIVWYFFPSNCQLTTPEDTRLCLPSEGCGTGLLYKSSKGQGPVDRSELWKWHDGLVKIDYSKCGENIPKK